MKHAALFTVFAFFVASLTACTAGPRPDTPLPLARAHAHNDYYHPRPLLDALDHGFCSVEADIFLVDGELLVAHDLEDVQPERTLQTLYLDPLRERARQFDGQIYPKARDGSAPPPFTLLIDVKNEGEATFPVLIRVLQEYEDVIDVWEPDAAQSREQNGAVVAVISGARPLTLMQQQAQHWVRYDGRLSDLDSDLPAAFMPLISDSWPSHFTWMGEGEMPQAERAKLHDLVERAHAQNRRVRFWAIPESEPLWQELHEAGVDLINTDELGRLQGFLLEQRE